MTRAAPKDSAQLERRVRELAQRASDLRAEIGRVILGQDRLVEDLLIAVLAGGHVLLEGLPGLGKTKLVKTLASTLGLDFARVQFTPDLMPADVTGTRIVEDHGGRLSFRFERGPLFANLVLADEINRATPKTQSALLEAMQEGQVTVSGETHPLPQPFVVVATQNPIELEGTFPLPEAQLDRFLFKLEVGSPDVDALVRILDSTTGSAGGTPRAVLQGEDVCELQGLARDVLCDASFLRTVAILLRSSDPTAPDASEQTRRLVRYGASPRGGQAIVLAAKVAALLEARPHVSRADIERSVLPALRHRIVLTFEAEADGVTVASLVRTWLAEAWRKTS
ncbi:MAG: AAA family ATPase [Planctomycetota bacterium]